MEDCTVVKVDSVNKQGLHLEMVQVLTDMNLTISKSYISSDGGWLMDGDSLIINYLTIMNPLFISIIWFLMNSMLSLLIDAVFHVKDENGNKLNDKKVINYIQQVINQWINFIMFI